MDYLLSLIPDSGLDWSLTFFVGIVILGCLIGTLTGFFGVGGGFLLTPALNIVFGIPYTIAVGSGLLQILCISTFSAKKHAKKGNVDVKLGLVMAVTAVIGADVGKRVMNLIQGGDDAARRVVVIMGREHELLKLVMDSLFFFLVGAVMISMLLETRSSKKKIANGESDGNHEVETGISKWIQGIKIPPVMDFKTSNIQQMSLWGPVIVSFFVAILTGLMGVGGGFIMFPILVYVLGVPTKVAVGTSAFRILFSTGAGTVSHWTSGHVDLRLVGALILGSLVGVQLGVWFSDKVETHKVRSKFVYVLGLGVAMILYSLISSLFLGDPGAGGGH